MLKCKRVDCDRQFLDQASMADHAEAVHTFSDIERVVSDALREKHGTGSGSTVGNRTYVWISDIAEDWVVFTVDKPNGDMDLLRSSYSIVDGEVNLGEAAEVRRRTVYELVKAD